MVLAPPAFVRLRYGRVPARLVSSRPLPDSTRAGHEHDYGQVDEAEVAEGVQVPRVVGGHHHRQRGGGHGGHPRLHLPSADALEGKHQHPEPVAAMKPETAMCRWLM